MQLVANARDYDSRTQRTGVYLQLMFLTLLLSSIDLQQFCNRQQSITYACCSQYMHLFNFVYATKVDKYLWCTTVLHVYLLYCTHDIVLQSGGAAASRDQSSDAAQLQIQQLRQALAAQSLDIAIARQNELKATTQARMDVRALTDRLAAAETNATALTAALQAAKRAGKTYFLCPELVCAFFSTANIHVRTSVSACCLLTKYVT
jgi:hypothetical protein